MQTIKVGIIGFGLSGKFFHAPLLRQSRGQNVDYSVEMICTSRAAEVAEIFPGARVVSEARDLVQDQDLDLVVNCAPNAFHYSYSAAALESGKHVVIEKPFASSIEEAKNLVQLAHRQNKILTVFHNRRWDGDFLTLQKLIAENQLGKLKQVESHWDRWRPQFRPEKWKEQPGEGSGTFFDLAPHLIDQALVLFGIPDKIFADIHRQKEKAQTDDYFHLIFYYADMRIILHSSSFTASTPRFQVFGDRGSFIKYGVEPQEEQLKQGISISSPSYGIEKQGCFGILKNETTEERRQIISERGCYQSFYLQLQQAITRGLPPAVTAESALQTMQVMDLAMQSARSGKTVSTTKEKRKT